MLTSCLYFCFLLHACQNAGRNGECIRSLQRNTRCKIDVARDDCNAPWGKRKVPNVIYFIFILKLLDHLYHLTTLTLHILYCSFCVWLPGAKITVECGRKRSCVFEDSQVFVVLLPICNFTVPVTGCF
jgi:hypothetical protein